MAEDNKAGYYLSEVELTGYKSINNVKTSFKDGLNIIIGANASGKTNFMSFLNNSLDQSFDNLFEFSSKNTFAGSKAVSVKNSRKTQKSNIFDRVLITKAEVKTEIKVDDVVVKSTPEDFRFTNTFVKHGIPNEYFLVDYPFSLKIDQDKPSSALDELIFNYDTPYFLKKILISFYLSFFDLENVLNEYVIEEGVGYAKKDLQEIKGFLKTFSPIEDIRFNENYNVTLDKENRLISLSNFFIEFKIQNTWYLFSDLSDGTKRLFYLISEIGSSDTVKTTKETVSMDNFTRLVQIEEPELGVHPHQLMSLMQFIKEQSKEKQIIITTHSPMVLDVLEEDELDRIIVARYNQGSRSTELKHLSEGTIVKAKRYMKEAYLSDFWKYSDLER